MLIPSNYNSATTANMNVVAILLASLLLIDASVSSANAMDMVMPTKAMVEPSGVEPLTS